MNEPKLKFDCVYIRLKLLALQEKQAIRLNTIIRVANLNDVEI